MQHHQNKYDVEKEILLYMNQRLAVFPPEKMQGLLLPHGGYPYAGKILGQGYGLLRSYLQEQKIIPGEAVIIGPSHTSNFDGAFSIDEKGFVTSLGSLPILRRGFPSKAFEDEPSLEQHIPFLQVLDFKKVVPLVVGRIDWSTAKKIAGKLAKIPGFFIFSSDLSHGVSYDEAVKKDQRTLRILEDLDKTGFGEVFACGLGSLMVFLELCRLKKTFPRRIGYENSGDVTGEKVGVVGYGAMWF